MLDQLILYLGVHPAVLTAMGCDVGQGFLFGRALDVERLEGWLLGRSLSEPARVDRPTPALTPRADPPETQSELPHQLA